MKQQEAINRARARIEEIIGSVTYDITVDVRSFDFTLQYPFNYPFNIQPPLDGVRFLTEFEATPGTVVDFFEGTQRDGSPYLALLITGIPATIKDVEHLLSLGWSFSTEFGEPDRETIWRYYDEDVALQYGTIGAEVEP